MNHPVSGVMRRLQSLLASIRFLTLYVPTAQSRSARTSRRSSLDLQSYPAGHPHYSQLSFHIISGLEAADLAKDMLQVFSSIDGHARNSVFLAILFFRSDWSGPFCEATNEGGQRLEDLQLRSLQQDRSMSCWNILQLWSTSPAAPRSRDLDVRICRLLGLTSPPVWNLFPHGERCRQTILVPVGSEHDGYLTRRVENASGEDQNGAT
jgi:hypothetical protein